MHVTPYVPRCKSFEKTDRSYIALIWCNKCCLGIAILNVSWVLSKWLLVDHVALSTIYGMDIYANKCRAYIEIPVVATECMLQCFLTHIFFLFPQKFICYQICIDIYVSQYMAINLFYYTECPNNVQMIVFIMAKV